MFAYRTTFVIKQGCMGEALELVKEWAHKGLFADGGQIRCYTPSYGPRLFVFEFVIESEEARTKVYAEFNAKPETKEYWERWWSLAERTVSHERWNVTELG